MKRVYICYPINSTGTREGNRDHTYKLAMHLIDAQIRPIVPHLWIHFDDWVGRIYSSDTYLHMDFNDILTCDAVLAPDESVCSHNCTMECLVARAAGIPIFATVEEVLNHFKIERT